MPNSCSHPWEVTDMCTGTVTNMFVELWLISMRGDVMTDVSAVVIFGVGFGMLDDVGNIMAVIGLNLITGFSYAVKILGDSTIGRTPGSGAEVTASALGAMMDTLEWAWLASLNEPFRCRCALFRCWPVNFLDFNRILQTCKPSYHVWPSAVPASLLQFPNQEPPRPQQLILPDFFMMPHLRHTKLMVIVVAAACRCWSKTRRDIKRPTLWQLPSKEACIC